MFLDRDGTLIADKHFLREPSQVEVFPGVPEALRRLQDAGFLLFIVTNQSGIGRGYYSEADMHRVNERLLTELVPVGVRFARIYFSPEAPEAPSVGRKPSPAFLFEARDTFGVDLAQSYMVGDKPLDLQCGWNAGVKESLLVRTGYGAETERAWHDKPANFVVVDDFKAAADWILASR